MRQALASAPGNPAILFHAANYYLRLEDYPETLRQLTAVLRQSRCWPTTTTGCLRFTARWICRCRTCSTRDCRIRHKRRTHSLRFGIQQDKLEEAQESWQWIEKNSLTSVASAGSYVALLGKDSRWEEALQSWTDLAARLDPDYGKSNWIYNGGFEMKPVRLPVRLASKSTGKR